MRLPRAETSAPASEMTPDFSGTVMVCLLDLRDAKVYSFEVSLSFA